MTERQLRQRIGERIADHALWSVGDRVAVAVSGGLDSVVLLDLLVETASWHGGVLCVATVDHGTRPESSADAQFVVDLAERYTLPVHTLTLKLGETASEEACRAGRYGALSTLEVDRVALAHHRDDQAETMLLMLMRGSGLRGLGAMPWCRERWVRPLLDTSRAELREWATHRQLEWREDPTNQSPRFLRNRLRHEVLPMVEEIRPGAAKAMARSAARLASDAGLLDAMAEVAGCAVFDGWVGDREGLIAEAEPIARRILAHRLPQATSVHIDLILHLARRGTGRVQLPGGTEVLVSLDHVLINGVRDEVKG